MFAAPRPRPRGAMRNAKRNFKLKKTKRHSHRSVINFINHRFLIPSPMR
jgi:hypothetical protein